MPHFDLSLTDVHSALQQSPHLGPRRDFQLDAAEGRITLRGVVRSFFEKQMAQEAIRHLRGVDQICNELEVWRD